MRKIYIRTSGIAFLFVIIILLLQKNSENFNFRPIPGSCTIFSISIGETVFFGNNEDYNNPETYYWTEPPSDGNYGCLYLGFENNSLQGGINEKGLCFDANSLPNSKINPHSELPTPPFAEPPYEKYTMWAPVLILKKASTVEEAIKIAGQYQRRNWDWNSGNLGYQINLADAKGDAVIISVDKEGELIYTRKQKGYNYLVSTNFNRANSQNAWSYPCWRYDKAVEMLDDVKETKNLTVDYMKSILDSVHVEGADNNTLYSNIFDLKNRIVYLYHWHQFDEVAALKVDEELAKGKINVRIQSLFSKETIDKAAQEIERYKQN